MAISKANAVPTVVDDGRRAGEAAELLKALAHPLRLRIVALLCRGEAFVNAIAEQLHAPQSIVSQQLRILRLRTLVDTLHRDGRTYYRLARPHLRRMVRCVEECLADSGGRS